MKKEIPRLMDTGVFQHAIERELQSEPPRTLAAGDKWRITIKNVPLLVFWFPGLVFVVGGVCTGYFMGRIALEHQQHYETVQQKGVTTEAVITRKAEIRVRTGRGSRQKRVIQYTFEDAQGTTCQTTREISHADWKGLETGQAIHVKYLPDNPEANIILDVKTFDIIYQLLWLPVAFLVPGIIYLSIAALGNRKVLSLLQQGRAVVGEVIEVKKLRYEHYGKKHPYKVRCRFADDFGTVVESKTKTLNVAAAERLHPGDPVTVLYYPYKSKVNLAYSVLLDGMKLTSSTREAWN